MIIAKFEDTARCSGRNRSRHREGAWLQCVTQLIDSVVQMPLASIIHGGRWLALAVHSPAPMGLILAVGYDNGPAVGPGGRGLHGPRGLLPWLQGRFVLVRLGAGGPGCGSRR